MQDEEIRIIVYDASLEFQSFLNPNTDIEELEVITLVDGDVIRYGNVGSKKDKNLDVCLDQGDEEASRGDNNNMNKDVALVNDENLDVGRSE